MTTPAGSLLNRRALAARRGELLLRSAELRARLGADCAVFRPAFRLVDRARAGAEALDRHRPLIVLGVAALAGAAAMRPRAAMRLGVRALAVWQFAQRVKPLGRVLWRRVLKRSSGVVR
jgi:hypothetical protein